MRLTYHHAAVFMLTFCIYMIFHASRKVYSDVKDSFCKEWTSVGCNSSWPCLHPDKLWRARSLFSGADSAELFLGLLDTLFLFSYAVGMYFTSAVADRFELRKVLSLGMWISGVLLFLFGVLTEWIHLYNKAFYAILWILQGIVQSVGWPSCVAAVGNWFGKSGRGVIFGLWGSCASVGNIVGNAIAGGIVFYGYEYAFLTVSAMMLGGGIVIFFGLVNSPEEIGLEKPAEDYSEHEENQQPCVNAPASNTVEHVGEPNHDFPCNSATKPPAISSTDLSAQNDVSGTEEKALSFIAALSLPGVIPYSLSFACLKLVNYAFLFWLPFYLVNNFKWNESLSSDISTWYDVGGVLGGIVCGILSDRLNTRSPVLLAMLIISPFTLWGYKSSPRNVTINSVLMAIVGFFINGVSNILSSAIAVDLAKQKHAGKNKKALATVTGIIDGTGSLGAAIGQYLVAVIQTKAGWGWVFNFFILANVAAIICLLPVFYNDFKQYSCPFNLPNIVRRNYSPILEDSDTNNNDDE